MKDFVVGRPTHPYLRHPRTGEPLRAVGFTKRGVPIWPVMGGSEPDSNPNPSPPAPNPAPPVPAPPAPAPQPSPPGVPEGEHGYPENTPVAQMTPGQQVAYWRHQARKHEQRNKAMSDYEQLKAAAAELEQLKAQTMTEHERAVAEAKKQGRVEALQEAGNRLVEQFFRAALHGRLDEGRLNALLGPLDLKQFLTADGLGVDAGKVSQFAALVAPPAPPAPPAQGPAAPAPAPAAPATGAGPKPDMGQGSPVTPKDRGLDRGREIARQRFGVPKPAQ